MKPLVIDSSSLISLSTNCLLWVLDALNKESGLQLIMTPDVRKEVVTKALKIERFRLSAVRVLKRLGSGVIRVEETDPSLTKSILRSANSIYSVNGSDYKIVHQGEVGLIPLAQSKGTNLMLIDERIVDKLINNPLGLKELFERRLHTKVVMDKGKLERFQSLIKNINVMKSSDLIAIAYEKGLLKQYIKETHSKKTMNDFVSGALWGLKDSGCSISTLDINEYLRELF